MAKKSNISVPAIAVIRIIVFLFIGCVGFLAYSKTMAFMTTSPLFAVKDVVIDASIQFIDPTELRRLKGRNVFRVDLPGIQKRLQAQYPQIDQLRVIRELPDRIKVLARKREPMFQAAVKGKMLMVDTEGRGMYYTASAADLPIVKTQGAGGSFKAARDVIGYFHSRPHLRPLKVVSLDMSNPTRVELVLYPAFQVILDAGNYRPKLDMLDMLVSQKKIDFAALKYIDLRFNEPVLAENTDAAAGEKKITNR